MKSLKSFTTLLLIVVVLIFALQNIAAVEIQFLFWSFSIPRALMIVTLMGIGFLSGLLFFSLVFARDEASCRSENRSTKLTCPINLATCNP